MNTNNSNIDVEKGIDFILNHFNQDKLYPRTIMTKRLGYQKEVFSKKETSQYFQESKYKDCRINAFPSYIEFKEIQRYPPDFIFIDLDRNNFKTEKLLEVALKKTLKKYKRKIRWISNCIIYRRWISHISTT